MYTAVHTLNAPLSSCCLLQCSVRLVLVFDAGTCACLLLTTAVVPRGLGGAAKRTGFRRTTLFIIRFRSVDARTVCCFIGVSMYLEYISNCPYVSGQSVMNYMRTAELLFVASEWIYPIYRYENINYLVYDMTFRKKNKKSPAVTRIIVTIFNVWTAVEIKCSPHSNI